MDTLIATSNLGDHFLPMSHKKDARLLWVNLLVSTIYFYVSLLMLGIFLDQIWGQILVPISPNLELKFLKFKELIYQILFLFNIGEHVVKIGKQGYILFKSI